MGGWIWGRKPKSIPATYTSWGPAPTTAGGPSRHLQKVGSLPAEAPRHLEQLGGLPTTYTSWEPFPPFTTGGKPSRRGIQSLTPAAGPSHYLHNPGTLPAIYKKVGSFSAARKGRKAFPPITKAGKPSRRFQKSGASAPITKARKPSHSPAFPFCAEFG